MATITRRHPAALDLGDWMSRFFDDRLLPAWTGLERDVMRLEEFTDEGSLVIRAELPGIDPDKDVEISMHDGMLHLRAERKESTESTGRSEYRTEFRYGLLERTLPLPAGIKESDVTATYKDGILEVRLPKATGSTSATVPVVRLP